MMKVTLAVTVCMLSLCLVEKTCCKAINKGGNSNVPLNGGQNSSTDVDVTHSKSKLPSTPNLESSGREMDVDDTSDLLVHDVRELLETREPCGKGGVGCRRRKKRQFSKLLNDPQRPTPGTNDVYDLRNVDDIHDGEFSSPDPLLEDDGDDDDDGHIVILRLRKRRDSDIASDDSDEENMFGIGDNKLSYSEIFGSYLHGEDDLPFRTKRDMSDSSFTDDLEDDSDDDYDNDDDSDLSISSDDWSLPLPKDRPKRETDTSSLDTFEEENDEMFDNVVDDDGDDDTDDESAISDVDKKTAKKRQQLGLSNKSILQEPANHVNTQGIPNHLGLVEQDKFLINNKFAIGHRTGQTTKQTVHELQEEVADNDSSSSNAKNSGPETESDAELSDIPFDAQSGVVLDRVPRDDQDITVYEEGSEPNSGENHSF